MTQIVEPGPRFDVGLAMRGAARVLRRRWLMLLILALGFEWAPIVALGALPLAGLAHRPGLIVAATLARAIVSVAIGGLFRAAVSAITLTELAGRRPSLPEAASASVSAVPALIPYLLIVNGADFISPFLMRDIPLMTALSAAAGVFSVVVAAFLGLAVPAMVAERLGFLAAARRSTRLLSSGRFTFVALYIGYRVVDLAPRTFVLAWLTTMQAALPAGLSAQRSDVFLLAGLPSLVIGLVWCVFSAAIYRELCRVRDGLPPGEVAAVFE